MEWYWILAIVFLSLLLLFILSWLLYKPFFKRFWDILLSGVAILILLPIFILLIIIGAIVMKGNPFFAQPRPGRKEKVFKLIKFRSMNNKKDKNGKLLPDEQRLSKYGKLLRALSLDELPELFNIFVGDMSIVGPRPLLVNYLDFYTPFEKKRHNVRPGLTGYAQVHGRNNATWEDKFYLDNIYVDKFNLFLDLKIILNTFFMVFKRTGVEDAKQEIKISNCINVRPLDVERKESLKEIGSSFWVSDNELKKNENSINTNFVKKLNLDGRDACFTSTGRSAIELAINNALVNNNSLPKIAVLPTFSCESVYSSFIKNGFEIKQYGIGHNLEITDDLDCLTNGAGILLIHQYFGFNTFFDKNVINNIKKKGVVVIEDLTQCLFSSFPHIDADYWVGSIRKWFGVPDGGFLISAAHEIINKPTKCDEKLEKVKLEAQIKKYDYIFNNKGQKECFLKEFKNAEDILNNQNDVYAISNASLNILSHVDFDEIISKRRENFGVLVNALNDKGIFVFSKLDNGVTPLYCLIRISKRKELQLYLQDNNIYAPIIWPKEGMLGQSECFNAYKNLLAIPIDQRYSEKDMIRIAKCLNAFLAFNR